MKKAALSLPLLSLLLHADRVLPPNAPPPPPYRAEDLPEVYRALPPINEGRFGRPGDVLNLLFLGTEAGIRTLLERAGWTSLPLTISGCFRAGLKQLFSGQRVTRFPPMNEYTLMGRPQDMNWVQPVRFLTARHHFRLWRTGITDARGREVWWGSGDYDLSLRLRDLSHRPDPDIDMERDYIGGTLKGLPAVERLSLIELPHLPRQGLNDKGYEFRTDGRALLVELR